MTINHDRPRVTGTLRLGTRRSQLAVAQAGWAARRIAAAGGTQVDLVMLSTTGDESDAPIDRIGSTGVFVTALREALLDGRVDLAVHSFKDLPTAPQAGIRLAAVPEREDPRDALVWWRGAGGLGDLPAGSRVGTGAPRRAAQIRALFPELEIVPLRGNVDSRLRRAAEGDLDAVVLAMAGLSRLDRLGVVSSALPTRVMLPAPTQGALAIECREDDERVASLVKAVDHVPTHTVVTAERAFLSSLNAGCTAPVGALAELTADPTRPQALCLEGLVAAADGSTVLRRSLTGDPSDGAGIGERLARSLLVDGGGELLALPPHDFTDPRTRPTRPLARG